MDQRFLQLPFTANGALLDAQLPSRAGDVPPGYYMLFVLNEQGVPSVARMVRVGNTTVDLPIPPVPDLTPVAGGAGGGALHARLRRGRSARRHERHARRPT